MLLEAEKTITELKEERNFRMVFLFVTGLIAGVIFGWLIDWPTFKALVIYIWNFLNILIDLGVCTQ